MHPQRQSALSLAALAISLLSCQFTQEPASLPAVGAAPLPAVVEAAPQPSSQEAPAAEPVLDVVEARLLARARSLTPNEVARLADAVRSEAARFGLAPDLVLAVIEVESQFDAFAVSSAGAMGLMQILPGTGEALARRYGQPWHGPRTLFDPVVNVRLGIAYLAELRHRFGQWPTALAAYNWGPGAIGRRLTAGDPIPVGYARRVLSTRERRAALEAQTS
ncbi:MAG: lytic transglycosylase domain-containing protein [Deltaproteobacteria bacterium]|nr:lytic transglycosylase domain-containing protein [Deltaproteobacteria bacterium]MBW2362613.1 lytic transglycosylase domain-containing protein [Deltaproteobacteria bacterium]